MDEPTIERFKIKEEFGSILKIMFDDKEISIADLVYLANQLTSALNDRGCYFDVKNNEQN